jgi:hypothetical protein
MTDLLTRIEEALSGPPFPVMARERFAKLGYRLVEPGERPWFSRQAWEPDSFLARKRHELMIVLLVARRPGTGAFTRLLAALDRKGWRVRVVAPLGPVLPDMLLRRGFLPEIVDLGDGDETDVWERLSS